SFTTPPPSYISTLSLHDALPISPWSCAYRAFRCSAPIPSFLPRVILRRDPAQEHSFRVLCPTKGCRSTVVTTLRKRSDLGVAWFRGDRRFFLLTNPRPGQINGEPSLSANWRSSRSEEHTSELQSRFDLVCRLLLE